jgi:hypothetical protein
VIAALAAEEDVRRAPARRVKVVPVQPAPAAGAAPSREQGFWGADLGAIAGPGFTGGPLRFGGFIRVWRALSAAPQVLFVGSARYALRERDPTGRWLSIGAGVGARAGRRAALLSTEVIGELVFEEMEVVASRPLDGATDGAFHSRFGGRIGVNLSLRLSSFARIVVGGDATVLTPPIKVEVENTVVEREPTGRVAVTAGLRLVP